MLNKLILWLFEKRFGTYSYPFKSSDEKIAQMKDAERTEYYRQAKELSENRAWIQEMEELIRTNYRDLSIKSNSKIEQGAYRLTLIALQALDKRIRIVGSMYKAPSFNKTSNDALN